MTSAPRVGVPVEPLYRARRSAARLRRSAPDLVAVAVIAALWIAMVRVVHPGGEFPLADDWAYARSVRALLERGELELRPWTPAITLSHVLWGALASALLGFSAESLRLSTLFLGLVGCIATYGLMRELGVGRRLAGSGALTIAANPLYFGLASTFMTDVPFVAMSTLALWGLVRALRSGSDLALALGTAAALGATLNRQIGLALVLGFAVAGLLPNPRRGQLRSLLPLLVTLACLLGWELFVRRRGGPSLASNAKTVEALIFLTGPLLVVAGRVLWNVALLAAYLGLFVLPLAVVAASACDAADDRRAERRRGSRWAALVVVSIAGAALLAWLGALMPFAGNIWLPSGIGPVTLRDTFILELPHLPEMPLPVRWLLTAGSVAGCVLAVRLFAAARLPRWAAGSSDAARRASLLLLASVGGLYVGALLIAPCLDRYVLPLLPIALALLAAGACRPDGRVTGAPSAGCQAAAVALIALSALYSVAAVHDLMAWNRARWAACAWLTETRGAAPSSIDGGFEWSAVHLYDPAYEIRPERSWWWVRDDRWVVSFGPIAGRRAVHVVPYRRWLPPGSGQILVLERLTEGAVAGS